MSNFTPNQRKREQVRRKLIFDDEPDIPSSEPHNSSEADAGSSENTKTPAPKPRNQPKVDNDTQPAENFESASTERTFKITDLSQMTEEHRLEQMARWNFDFENEIPLTGDWEWERVTPVAPSVNHKEKICALDKKETNSSDRNV